MYHCLLRIQICSRDTALEAALKQIPPFERFEHLLFCSEHISRETVEKSDVIILDFLPDEDMLLTISQNKKKNAIIICCVLPEEVPALVSVTASHAFDSLWLKPLDRNNVFFYFSKVQQQLKLNMDFQLQQKYLNTLIDSIPDLVWFKDIKGEHLKVNDSFCRTVGKTKEDVQGRGHYYIWDLTKEEYEGGEYVCLETDETVLQEKRTCLFDEQVKSKEGLRQFRTYKSPIFGDDGEPIGTVGIAHDVTDLRNAYAELEIVIENMPFAILIFDPEGRVLSVNTNFINYFHVLRETVIGSDYWAWEANTFLNRDNHNNWGDFVTQLNINGEMRQYSCFKKPILDIFENVFGYVCTFIDITEEYRLKEKLIISANTDELTGLYNRRYLYEFIGSKRSTCPVCLLYLDIDNFKMINDIYGHKTGDQVLIDFSGILMNIFSEHKAFRIGGDEFLVALLNVFDADVAKTYAQKLLDGCKKHFGGTEKFRDLTVSIGIALDNDTSLGIEDLIRKGDSALYLAKRNGKNQYSL